MKKHVVPTPHYVGQGQEENDSSEIDKGSNFIDLFDLTKISKSGDILSDSAGFSTPVRTIKVKISKTA